MSNQPDRNAPCHCGSGKKHKHCCQGKVDNSLTSKLGISGLVIAIILGLVVVALALSGGDSPNCPPGTTWSDAHQHCH